MVKKSELKKLNSIMEQAEKLKTEKKYNKAVEKYLESINFVEERIKEDEDKKDEINNIKTQIDQIYAVEIMDILEKAKMLIDKKDFNDAFTTFDEALRIAEKIEDFNLKNSELTEINALITYSKIEESIYQGEKLLTLFLSVKEGQTELKISNYYVKNVILFNNLILHSKW